MSSLSYYHGNYILDQNYPMKYNVSHVCSFKISSTHILKKVKRNR